MQRADVEQIARTILRDYGLPFRLEAVSVERAGVWTVGFSDSYSGAKVRVGVWCNAKVSAHSVRESLKRGLQVSD